MSEREEVPSIGAVIKLVRATQRLAREKGREPTIVELAAEMKMPADEVRHLVEVTQAPMTFRPAGQAGAN